MSLALFDVLEGRPGRVTPVESAPGPPRAEHRREPAAAAQHAADSVPHLLEYGLPDLVSAQQDTSASTETLRLQVRAAVIAYEPRLSRVVETGAPNMRISFISGVVLERRRCQLETIFVPGADRRPAL